MLRTLAALTLLASLAQAQVVTRLYIVDSLGQIIHAPLAQGDALTLGELPRGRFNVQWGYRAIEAIVTGK